MLEDILLKIGGVIVAGFFLGMCIFVHELGHFLAAKWRGLHIQAFSIGFKKLWGWKRNGIDYRIGWIPFGGYVDLPQIDTYSGDIKTEDGKKLPPAKPLDRIATAAAGPFFNILFGLVLGTFLWIHGIPQDSPRMRSVEVLEVEEGSAEYEAGLKSGDRIVAINGEGFNLTWRKMVEEIIFTRGKVTLTVLRDGKKHDITYKPEQNSADPSGRKLPLPFFTVDIPVTVYPAKGSPAARAGIKEEDVVVAVNGEKVDNYLDVAKFINYSKGRPLDFRVKRRGEIIEFNDVEPVLRDVKAPLYRIGISMLLTAEGIIISEVQPDSPAEAAGLKAGDRITAIDGSPCTTNTSLQQIVSSSRGQPMTFTVERDGAAVKIEDIRAKELPLYTVGFKYVFYDHPNPFEQFTEVITLTVSALRSMFSDESAINASHMSGPVGIFRIIAVVVHRGAFIRGLYVLVLITFSLALFNLLPIPVLDGGFILLALIESAIRRPLPAKIVKPAFTVSLVLLISLMIFVTFFDVGDIVRDTRKLFGIGSGNGSTVENPEPGAETAEESDTGTNDVHKGPDKKD